KAHPSSPRARHALAFALLRANRPDEGQAELARLRQLAPSYAPGHYLAGMIAQLSGNLVQAEAAFRRALRVQKDFAEANFRLCQVLAKPGRVSEARPHCLAFIESAPPSYAAEIKEARAISEK